METDSWTEHIYTIARVKQTYASEPSGQIADARSLI